MAQSTRIHAPARTRTRPSRAPQVTPAEARELVRAIRAGEADAVVEESRKGVQLRLLAGTEEPYRLVVEAMGEGALVLDDRGQVIFANPALGRLLARRPRELIGKQLGELMAAEDWAQLSGPRSTFLKRGGTRDVELTSGRDTVPAHLTARPLRAGSFRGLTVVVTDYSELYRLANQLELRVAERTAALQHANDELEAFSYSASHDLQAPLRAIGGFTDALESDCGRELSPECRQYLDRIARGVDRMRELIEALLLLSRVGRAEMHRERVDLSATARGIAGRLAASAPRRQVTFEIAPGVTGMGDPALLEQLLQNLLDNAWKFTTGHERARIEFGRLQPPSSDVLYVRDDGVGFDMKHAERMFTPFQRFHSADAFPGEGIGLSIVRRIIARHGGRIWAESEPERGATFFFTLGRPAPARLPR